MSEKLEEIRKKIDELDNRIHDLLMERADLIVGVTEEKKKGNIPVVQPAREARMIRRLLARHRGPLPEAAIVHIWRELVGAVSLLQTGLKVAVSAENGQCWDMARDYFGSVLPMVKVSTPLAAISAVREGEANFAVVPWPQDGESNPWWTHLKDGIRIVCAMPYGSSITESQDPRNRAIIVSKTDYAPSGEDNSFVIIDAAKDVSRTRIIDEFGKLKLKVLGISSRAPVSKDHSQHLVEIDDYILDDDARLQEFSSKFTDYPLKAFVAGGYPVPPVYGKAKQERGKDKKTGT
ncbi:MAG: chorismate mutase [Alphaproteobacteria bacterium]|nr:chorismate mutase [Alphaproteobacteria bacterium]